MKLVKHGTKANQKVFCDCCGAEYIGSPYDDNVKATDWDYTMSGSQQFFFNCEQCKHTIYFTKHSHSDNGEK